MEIEEDEVLPDIPNILTVLEETLQLIEEEEDLSKITKRQLALNQQNIIDALISLAKFVVSKGYVLDLLDKAIAKKFTLEEDLKLEDDDDEDNNKLEDETKKLISDMFT